MLNNHVRFIQSDYENPFMNMAIDEALFLRGGLPPTVRFYRWKPPALSLGYFQDSEEFDFGALRRNGIVIVRRHTGGGAIFHHKELTFSITAPRPSPLRGGSIEAAYRNVHSVIIHALRKVGISSVMRGDLPLPPHNNPTSHSAQTEQFCFNRPIFCDIVSGGRKLVGSAQRQNGTTYLQHGSIPLEKNPLTPKAAYVNQSAEIKVTYNTFSEILKNSFEECLKIRLVHSELASEELQLARELAASRYSTDKWNRKR